MAQPTVSARRARRLIVFASDAVLREAVSQALPAGWQATFAQTVSEVGEFQDVLLHRFVLLDLDEAQAFDPVAIVEALRSEMMLNIPIFCFGGDPALRDAARLARADRFFERGELAARLPDWCEQFGW